jgi:hypothetical protein
MTTEVRATAMLRGTLRSNAIFSLLSGAAFVAANGSLGDAFGIPHVALGVFGVILLGFSAHLWFVAQKDLPVRGEALYFVIADACYVVASVVVLVGFPQTVSPTGRLFFWVVADVVGVFCVLEYAGLRQLTSSKLVRA